MNIDELICCNGDCTKQYHDCPMLKDKRGGNYYPYLRETPSAVPWWLVWLSISSLAGLLAFLVTL